MVGRTRAPERSPLRGATPGHGECVKEANETGDPTTHAHTSSPRTSWGTPITRTSFTAGCARSRSFASHGGAWCPPRRIVSRRRSTIRTHPMSSMMLASMPASMLASPATKKRPGANWRRFTKSTDLTVGSRRGIPHQQVEHHRHAAKDRDALGLEQPKRRTPLDFLIVPRARPDALEPLRGSRRRHTARPRTRQRSPRAEAGIRARGSRVTDRPEPWSRQACSPASRSSPSGSAAERVKLTETGEYENGTPQDRRFYSPMALMMTRFARWPSHSP